MPSPYYIAPAIDSASSFKDNLFNERVLFCTGGGSGICKGMTEAIMRHGANAVIIGRNLDRLKASAEDLSNRTGNTCIPAQADSKKTMERFGRIDFVICGAAGNFMAPIAGLSENAFKTVLEIDTLGTYNTIKATIQHVRATKGAYISVSATLHYRGTPYQAHVSAAKAAVDSLSNTLAVEEGPHGVRSNVIAPGFTSGTEGMRVMTGNKRNKADGFSNPLGRFTEISDIANAAVFLFSPSASFITGQIIPIDGGGEHLRGDFFPLSGLCPRSIKCTEIIEGETLMKAKGRGQGN
ncbi:2,4-dienoyl-CoA reductase [Rhodocollybia butyracea]|uniref:2,4-dienoyl-CoA reductase [(3E)-enoyl-CoA-producing] n=1 Tax=Rhodocollybia butyracea TaxID=206335 RepID=A0A9P5TY53_9AGAR|nr:2,4-dienoyl-CoA reductase [Rhodocollybia butyracea]